MSRADAKEGCLLKAELNAIMEYHAAWEAKQCTMLIPGSVKEHTAAWWLTDMGKGFTKDFQRCSGDSGWECQSLQQ